MGKCASRLGRIVRVLGRDPVLWAAGLAAAVSAFFVPPSADYLGYLDLRTLGLLLALMLAVAGLQTAGAFDALVARMLRLVRSTRALAAVLTGLCFFCSMASTLPFSVPFSLLESYSPSASIMAPSRLRVRPSR